MLVTPEDVRRIPTGRHGNDARREEGIKEDHAITLDGLAKTTEGRNLPRGKLDKQRL